MTGEVGKAQKISLNSKYSTETLICTEDIGNLPSHIETVKVVGPQKEGGYCIPMQLRKRRRVLVLKRKKEVRSCCSIRTESFCRPSIRRIEYGGRITH